jgi:tetratricopeptide (TPR) repeat protein
MTDLDSRFSEAVKHYRAGRYEEARVAFMELAELKPHSSEVQLNLGDVYFQTGAYDEAKACFRKALELDPMEANAYLNLGNLFFKLDQPQEAVAQWEIYIRIEKNSPKVWLNLGVAYDKLADPEKAWLSYSTFLNLNPTASDAVTIKERFEAAKRSFENKVQIADAHLKRGQRTEAIDIYRQALAIYPGNARIYKLYASLLYQTGQLEQALLFYRRAYGQKPDDASVLINLGVIFEKLNQPIGAMWAYHQASTLPSDERNQVVKRLEGLLASRKPALHDGLAQAQTWIRQGRYQDAETRLTQLAALSAYLGSDAAQVAEWQDKLRNIQDPSLKAAKVYLARAADAEANGRFDQAVSFFEKYLRLRPNSPDTEEIKQRIARLKALMSAAIQAFLKQSRD